MRICDTDLAAQAAVGAHIEGKIQHVFFGLGGFAGGFAPGVVNINMAGCARARAAAFGGNARNAMLDRSFHDGLADLGFNGGAVSSVVDKGDFGHRYGRSIIGG
jgi:hypothetical protein